MKLVPTDRAAPDGSRVHLLYLEDVSGFEALVGLILEKDGLYGAAQDATPDPDTAARRILGYRAAAVHNAAPSRRLGSEPPPQKALRRPGRIPLPAVHVTVERHPRGGWQAEARTMEDLGLNLVNYNHDSPEEAVEWLKKGLDALGFVVGSYTVEAPKARDKDWWKSAVQEYTDEDDMARLLCPECADDFGDLLEHTNGGNPLGLPCEECGAPDARPEAPEGGRA